MSSNNPPMTWAPPTTESLSISLPIGRREWAAGFLVFLGYYLGSKLGFALTFRPHPVSVLWPPNSILLAALLIAPVRLWWFLLLAALPAHWLSQVQGQIPPTMILCYFVSNSCEALIGAGCVRYFVARPMRFDQLRNVALFCFFGGLVGPFLSSFLDAAFVSLNHWGVGTYWEIWRIRFFSNVLTALIVAPAIVTWFTTRAPKISPLPQRRIVEGAILFGGLIAVCIGTLYIEEPVGDPVIFYAPLPFLLWATLRFGSRGTATAILTIAFLAIWSAAHGHGPFTAESPEENARSIQLFLTAMTIPFLFLGAVIEEREIAGERFTKAFQCNPDAMGIMRVRDGMIVDVNEQWEEFLGHKREDAIGRTVFELNVWENTADRAELVARIERGPVRDFDTSWCNKAGEVLPVSLSADVVEMAGEAGLVIIIRDMRDRKRAEEAARDLVRASRLATVGELTASLAHELNQPLTAIASNAAAGRRYLDHGSTDWKMFRELLADVGSDAQRASEVILGIHHLVRKGEHTRQLLNLNDVIAETLRLLHSNFIGRGISVRTEFAGNLPAVPADPVHLQQVILNLFLNALEAMQSAGVTKREIIVSTELDAIDRFARVSVRDHGIGLPVDNPEKIFEHFYSTKPNGMGMGLTIVRSIVEAHGGTLSAENTGDGANISFRLPIAVESQEEAVA